MDTRTGGRGLEIATAVALGVVSLVTALGVLQSSLWNDTADRLASDAADARDQSISIAVVSQLRERGDLAAILEARPLAQEYDLALAAGDFDRALDVYGDLGTKVATAFYLPDGSFDAWWAAGFPDDARPTDLPDYRVALYGDVDALTATSRELGEQASTLKARSAVFGQASLVLALALFLYGVAGINRLRAARYVTLAMGSLVFVFGLFLMSTAY
ncbi:hypothetical protein [Pseudolysinimonas sp.]|uniref:hypothetical protein n=1 Tax=Pseudolysinimonas sp. TaxID=2680009 RepID=UPI003784961B